MRAAAGGALATALSLIGIGCAATTHADTDSYLNHLHSAGINAPGGVVTRGGDIEMKEWGWEVCALFTKGVDPGKVRDQAVYNSGSKPQYGMTVAQADAIVHFAAVDLCADPR